MTSLAFSPDGRFLASGSWDRTIKIWNPLTGEDVKTLSFIKPAPIASLAFSPDGKLLALGGWNKATLMNLVDGKQLATLDISLVPGGTVTHVVLFSPDGKTLITAGVNSLRAWNIETRRLRAMLLDEAKEFFRAQVVAMSHDGKLLASGHSRGVVTLWDMDTEKRQYSFSPHGDKEGVSALAFAPSERVLATGGQDGRTILWQLSPPDSPKEILTLKVDRSGINSIAFSPDGKLLATAAYYLRLWNVATGKLQFMIEGRRQVRLTQVAFSPDGATLAAGSEDGIVELWDIRKQTKRLTLKVEDSFPVEALHFSPDGKVLASATRRGQVIFWDPVTGDKKQVIRNDDDETPVAMRDGRRAPVEAVAFSPDGKILAAGGSDVVSLWDTQTWQVRRHFSLGGGHRIESLKFFPTGTLLATKSDHTGALWDVATGERVLGVHKYLGSVASLSPDGKLLAAVPSGGGAVIIWNTNKWERLFSLGIGGGSVVSSLAFSPDGKMLAGGDGKNNLALWMTPDQQRVPNVLNKVGCGDRITSLAFSPNSKWLATIASRASGLEGLSRPGCIRIFRLEDNKFSFMSWRTEPVGRGLAFSPDSKTLATPAQDSKIKLWRVD